MHELPLLRRSLSIPMDDLGQGDRINLGVASILGHRPEVAGALGALKAALVSTGTLSPRLVELVRLRIAFHNQCRSCMSVRYQSAIDDGLTEDLVCSLEQPAEADDLRGRTQRAAIRRPVRHRTTWRSTTRCTTICASTSPRTSSSNSVCTAPMRWAWAGWRRRGASPTMCPTHSGRHRIRLWRRGIPKASSRRVSCCWSTLEQLAIVSPRTAAQRANRWHDVPLPKPRLRGA